MKKFIPKDFKRNSEITPLKEALDSLLESYNLKKKYRESVIISTWESLMGKTIAKRTTKLFFKENKLFVELSSAPLKNELRMSKFKIIEMINRQFESPVVEDVVFL